MARLRQCRRFARLRHGLRCGLALAMIGGSFGFAHAQTSEASYLLRPDPDSGQRTQKRFQSPKYGNAPGFGAGTTGFDSSNKRRASKSSRRKVTAEESLPPVNVPAPDATLAPVFRQPARVVPPSPYPPALARNTHITPVRAVRRRPEEDAFAAPGIRAGSFVLRPAIEVSSGYDTNPARTQNGKGSWLTQMAPEMTARSDWSRHEVSADLRGNYIWYHDQPSLSRPNLEGKVNGRVDISSHTKADLEGRFQYSADAPGDPNLPTDIAEPSVYKNLGGTAGVTQRFNRVEVSIKGSADRKTYDDVILNDGSVQSQKDRNYDQFGTQLRGSYELSPGVKPFVEVGVDRRVHELAFDNAGVQRDSDGRTIRAGSTFELSKRLTGEASAGYLRRDYKDPTLQEVSGLIGDASLIWAATPLNTVTFNAKSSVDESTITGVSGILHREASIQVDHSFRRWLIGSVKFGYMLDTYQGIGREDQNFLLSAALIYKMTRFTQLKAEVRQERQVSNAPGNDHTANIYLLGLRWQQ